MGHRLPLNPTPEDWKVGLSTEDEEVCYRLPSGEDRRDRLYFTFQATDTPRPFF